MKLLNISGVKKYVKAHDKRIAGEAIDELEARVRNMVASAVRLLPKHIKTIQKTEITHAKG